MKIEIGSQVDQDQTSPELKANVNERFRYYDHRRRHSQIGNMPPLIYLADFSIGPNLTAK